MRWFLPLGPGSLTGSEEKRQNTMGGGGCFEVAPRLRGASNTLLSLRPSATAIPETETDAAQSTAGLNSHSQQHVGSARPRPRILRMHCRPTHCTTARLAVSVIFSQQQRRTASTVHGGRWRWLGWLCVCCVLCPPAVCTCTLCVRVAAGRPVPHSAPGAAIAGGGCTQGFAACCALS
jgi:hypothetical protein